MTIELNINNKIARLNNPKDKAVCGNSDFIIKFNFDDEWNGYDTKTARFVYCGKHTDVLFTGNECAMPVITDARVVDIGVYAGDLHTTTPARLFMLRSILCGAGAREDPDPDVYNQLMEMLNGMESVSEEEIMAAVEKYLKANPAAVIPGNALEMKDGTLNVVTTNEAEEDNTLPITSSGVHTIVGNIGAILDTI